MTFRSVNRTSLVSFLLFASSGHLLYRWRIAFCQQEPLQWNTLTLVQVSRRFYATAILFIFAKIMATRMGFEPTTSCVTGTRSNQLSYQAIQCNLFDNGEVANLHRLLICSCLNKHQLSYEHGKFLYLKGGFITNICCIKNLQNLCQHMVGDERLELSRRGHQFLRLACLPFHQSPIIVLKRFSNSTPAPPNFEYNDYINRVLK